jgi:hypothetical protein
MRNLVAVGLTVVMGSLLTARADLTIIQEMEGPSQNGDVTVKIKGDKERIDSPSQPTQIIDGKSGEMINLINNKKMFLRITADQMKAAAETVAKSEADAGVSSAKKLRPTGNKETINGYETEEYVYQNPNFRASFWVAAKYPDAPAILKEMQTPFSGAWKPSNMGMPDYTEFLGVPLRTVVSIGEKKVVTTVTSIKKDPISASEFEIPKDFQELKKPMDFAPPPVGSATASPSATR